MVRSIGFEPIHPEETDLQSAAALQLYRLRKINYGAWPPSPGKFHTSLRSSATHYSAIHHSKMLCLLPTRSKLVHLVFCLVAAKVIH